MITFLCFTSISLASEKYFATKYISYLRIREIHIISASRHDQWMKFKTTPLVFAFNLNFS